VVYLLNKSYLNEDYALTKIACDVKDQDDDEKKTKTSPKSGSATDVKACPWENNQEDYKQDFQFNTFSSTLPAHVYHRHPQFFVQLDDLLEFVLVQ